MIHVWTVTQQNGVELAQYRGKSICFLSFWDVSTIIFCLDCPCAKHKGVCLCETVFFIIYAHALTEFRASFVMWAWIDRTIPSNKQQTIAFFISTPASRPLPPPVLPGSACILKTSSHTRLYSKKVQAFLQWLMEQFGGQKSRVRKMFFSETFFNP